MYGPLILLRAATFVIFALVLEQLVHQLVFRSAVGATIGQNIWLYALYGGAMAGLFEESGRFIVFDVDEKAYGQDHDALMFASGHGGSR